MVVFLLSFVRPSIREFVALLRTVCVSFAVWIPFLQVVLLLRLLATQRFFIHLRQGCALAFLMTTSVHIGSSCLANRSLSGILPAAVFAKSAAST